MHSALEYIQKNIAFQVLTEDDNEQKLKTKDLYIGQSDEEAYKIAVKTTVNAIQTFEHKIDVVSLTIPEKIDQRLYVQELENTFPNQKKPITCSW